MRSETSELIGDPGRTKDQPWSDVWERGFIPLFTDDELSQFVVWLGSKRQPAIGRCHFRNVFELVCNDAVKRLGRHTYHWPFFAWFDAGPAADVAAELVKLLTEELAKREARRAQAAEDAVPLPQEGSQAGEAAPGTQAGEAPEAGQAAAPAEEGQA